MQAQELCHSKWLKEQKELCDLEAQQMVKAPKTPNKGIELSSHDDDPSLAQVLEKRTELSTTDNNPAVAQVLTTGTKAPVNSEHGEAQMHVHILQGYKKDWMAFWIPKDAQLRKLGVLIHQELESAERQSEQVVSQVGGTIPSTGGKSKHINICFGVAHCTAGTTNRAKIPCVTIATISGEQQRNVSKSRNSRTV
ncbi:hypothetical protein C0995_012072 [Termitomyces sp. Mi166|nr:hypothetical protein C0995_012072 [Termitomyces sp. Mi166\